MDGYDEGSYGAAFADVYDEWYQGISDIDATIATLLGLARPGAAVLELAVGTGRLAVPLAEAGAATGITVTGIDASPEMLARLATRDPGNLVATVLGDMVADLPPGPFELAFVAYNSLFNLTGEGQQAACFAAVAERLTPGGRFVVEAFVPDVPFRDGDDIAVRTLSADRLVLSVTRNDAAAQSAIGQFVELAGRPGEPAAVTLRPWAIRYRTPAQLDADATAAGLVLDARWEDFTRAEFTPESPRHVSVYRLSEAVAR
ncbi:MAG TPA: class I SAM-dependent methyltransferase [Ilumatobacter sp.]|nr:class I SAM-dependent methyltransferase [Ilumatobacter sp.]